MKSGRIARNRRKHSVGRYDFVSRQPAARVARGVGERQRIVKWHAGRSPGCRVSDLAMTICAVRATSAVELQSPALGRFCHRRAAPPVLAALLITPVELTATMPLTVRWRLRHRRQRRDGEGRRYLLDRPLLTVQAAGAGHAAERDGRGTTSPSATLFAYAAADVADLTAVADRSALCAGTFCAAYSGMRDDVGWRGLRWIWEQRPPMPCTHCRALVRRSRPLAALQRVATL